MGDEFATRGTPVGGRPRHVRQARGGQGVQIVAAVRVDARDTEGVRPVDLRRQHLRTLAAQDRQVVRKRHDEVPRVRQGVQHGERLGVRHMPVRIGGDGMVGIGAQKLALGELRDGGRQVSACGPYAALEELLFK